MVLHTEARAADQMKVTDRKMKGTDMKMILNTTSRLEGSNPEEAVPLNHPQPEACVLLEGFSPAATRGSL